MAMASPPTAPIVPHFERLRGRDRFGHTCKPPGQFSRWLHRVRVGDTWRCDCRQLWRWATLAIPQNLKYLRGIVGDRCWVKDAG